MVSPSLPVPSCTNCCCFNPTEPLTKFHWSRLESQLRENQPPSDIEIQTIAKLERDIEGYDLEISRLQSAILSLQYKRGLAADYVSRHKSLLAPIRRLPNDVLMEIFNFSSLRTIVCCEEVYLPQLDLSQVCSYWRSTVNTSSVLWSSFDMTFIDPTPSDATFSNDAMVNIVNTLLTRSMDRSLTMKLTSVDSEGDVHPALQLLLSHSHRWMGATLQCNAPVLERVLSVSGGFPRLRHLDIMEGATVTVPVAQYPSLRSLLLDMADMHTHHGISVSRQDFPWSQLKEVGLYRSTISELIDVLSWCTQLRSVSLYDPECAETRVSSDNSITSPTMVSMTLKNWVGRGYTEDFFRLAKFPQLHTLEMVFCRLPRACTYPFTAHSSLITTLLLTDLQRSDFCDVLELFRLLPTVINFQWFQRWSYMTSEATVGDLFSKLRPHPSRTLFPRLKRFDVEITDREILDINFTLSVFVEMIQARWMEAEHPNDRLTSVRLSFPENCLNHDLTRPLAYLLKAGMAISIEDKCGFIL